MGIYLSPQIDKVAVLEQLAGVPAETHQRLLDPGRDLPGRDGYDQAQAYYEEIFSDTDLNALDNLRAYGFGRIKPAFFTILREASKDTQAGSVTNTDLVRFVVDVQGVDLNGVPLKRLQGLSWS